MHIILGTSRLLQDTDLTAEQSSYLQMITNSGKLLLTIINDVLDFSRIESNSLELEYRRFSLLECVENACHLCWDMASKKQLDLTYHIDRSVPGYIFGDSVRLQQILLNLLSNACKFTPARGSIIVTVKCTILDADSPCVALLASTMKKAQQAQQAQLSQSNSASESPVQTASPHGLDRERERAPASPLLQPHSRLAKSSTPQLPSSRRLQALGPAERAELLSGGSGSETAMRDQPARLLINPQATSAPAYSQPSPSSPDVSRVLSSSMTMLSPMLTTSGTPLIDSSAGEVTQFVELSFSVQDTGLGISEETQSRLFKSFSQGDTSVVRKYGGTGQFHSEKQSTYLLLFFICAFAHFFFIVVFLE